MTERAKKLLLLYCKQGGKIRRVSGLPSLTFKAKKAGTLNNYRIYGNTVNGESVGEKTANLFDGEIEQGSVRINDGAETDSDYRIRTKKISVKPITTYTISSHLYILAICLYNDGVFVSTEVEVDSQMNAKHQITLTMPNNANQIQIVFKNSATDTTNNSALITPDDFEWGMLNSGSTALPYEPYGYKLTISSANTTTPVYLGEVETTRRIGKIDLSEVSWTKLASGLWRTTDIPNIKYVSANTEIGGGIAEKYTIHTGAGMISALNCIAIDVSQVSVNTGSDIEQPTGMFWYVLANETTGIVNEPIRKIGDYADMLTATQAGVEIPTDNGSTTFDIDTTLKPSEVYIKYKGR